jgi:hypothetical protein
MNETQRFIAEIVAERRAMERRAERERERARQRHRREDWANPQHWWQWAVALVQARAAILFVIGIMAAGTWYWVGPRWQKSFQPYLDIPMRIEGLGRRIGELERKFETIEPSIKIVEYDMTRSRVISPCKIGEWCSGVYRFRRTPFGIPCGTPSVEAFVSNHHGARYAIRDVRVVPVRGDRDWTSVAFDFKFPETALPGKAGFWFRANYDCTGVKRQQLSDPLVFQATSP